VIASSADGISRTGRVFATTGEASLTLRTEGLDAGDAAQGAWWLVYEPAAGHARLLILPARLDLTTFRATGIPAGQPAVVALVQTNALELDAATSTIYAPSGFAADWRRFARAWYASFIVAASGGTLTPTAIVPPPDAATTRYPLASQVALSGGVPREIRAITERDVDTHIAVDCSVSRVLLTVLTFSEVTSSSSTSPITAHAGDQLSFTGSCEPGATSWPMTLRASSLNGRSVMVMLAPGAPTP